MKQTVLTTVIIALSGLIGLYASNCNSSDIVLPKGMKIGSIHLIKSERKMYVFYQKRMLKSYTVSLGKNPDGHKQKEGDMKTPEGKYTIDDKNAKSNYHKNLRISYPNDTDKKFAEISGNSPGGNIKIHGLRNGLGLLSQLHHYSDWTVGCIAVKNSDIDELFEYVS